MTMMDDDSSYSSISHCSSFHLLTLVLSTILHPLRRLFAIVVVVVVVVVATVVAIIGIEFERDVMVTMAVMMMRAMMMTQMGGRR